MIKVGVCGLGMMGLTHLELYAARDDVEVVAVAERNPDRLSGKVSAEGNIAGQAQGGFDLSRVRRYADGDALIADPEVEVVDICLPTPLHHRYALLAIEADKHLLVEKPLCRSAAEAQSLVEAARGSDRVMMPAMCMRFWPGWDWLKTAIDEGRYGPVRAATFRRLCNHPMGKHQLDGASNGGALLDLHVHDIDFILHCFGMPEAVHTSGYVELTGQPDHVVTQYRYPDVPLVTAEGGWCMAEGFGFSMRYTVNFVCATAVFDLGAEHPLVLYRPGEDPAPIALPSGLGYEHEIEYFLRCIAGGCRPERVTLADGAAALRVYEAERESLQRGQAVVI